MFLDGGYFGYGAGIAVEEDPFGVVGGVELESVSVDDADVFGGNGCVGGAGAEVDEFEQGRHRQDGLLFLDGDAFLDVLADAGAGRGTDPDMGGYTPGDVEKRFYRIGVE